ncbi:hypothetical protein FQA39_LY02318 [Lamprigera yunnana]|nr:hypothetical protein FQA39_LY02318 [Lamprigera yunnana]
MYCTLEYIKLPIFDVEEPDLLTKAILLFQTREGIKQENKKLLFNPNCRLQLLLEYLCNEVGIDRNLNFDLCATDAGEMADIKQKELWSNALEVLTPIRNYVFVIFEKDQQGNFKILEPIINRQTKLFSEIVFHAKRLKAATKTTKKETHSSKKHRRHSSSSKISKDNPIALDDVSKFNHNTSQTRSFSSKQ